MGTFLHLMFGVLFGIFYVWLFNLLRLDMLPRSLMAGLGFGFAHGLISSYALMFFMDERHPVPRYRSVTFSVGLLYLFAHVIYGATLGLLMGVMHLGR